MCHSSIKVFASEKKQKKLYWNKERKRERDNRNNGGAQIRRKRAKHKIPK